MEDDLLLFRVEIALPDNHIDILFATIQNSCTSVELRPEKQVDQLCEITILKQNKSAFQRLVKLQKGRNALYVHVFHILQFRLIDQQDLNLLLHLTHHFRDFHADQIIGNQKLFQITRNLFILLFGEQVLIQIGKTKPHREGFCIFQ